MRPGGYVELSLPAITFVAEDSSTPNRISVYDMMVCDGGEVLCKGTEWTDTVRTTNGITRQFNQHAVTSDVTTRTLTVPYYEDGNWTTATTMVDGLWTSPCDEWRQKAAESWPRAPTTKEAAYSPSVQMRIKNAGIKDWPLYVHTRCNGLLCEDPKEAVANKFLVPTEETSDGWPEWAGAPPSRPWNDGVRADIDQQGNELNQFAEDFIKPYTYPKNSEIKPISKKPNRTWPPAYHKTTHAPAIATVAFTLLLDFDKNATTSLSQTLVDLGAMEDTLALAPHPVQNRCDL